MTLTSSFQTLSGLNLEKGKVEASGLRNFYRCYGHLLVCYLVLVQLHWIGMDGVHLHWVAVGVGKGGERAFHDKCFRGRRRQKVWRIRAHQQQQFAPNPEPKSYSGCSGLYQLNSWCRSQ